MPDSFFQSDKKRKRPSRGGNDRNSGGSKPRNGRSNGGAKDISYGLAGDEAASRRAAKGKGKGGRSNHRDEDLDSDVEGDGPNVDLDDMDFRNGRGGNDEGEEDDDVIDRRESAAEKRVRLAKGYLQKVRDELAAENEDDDFDAAEIDRDLIASRLQHDVAEAEGKIHVFLRNSLLPPITRFIRTQTPTSVALTPKNLYVATKRGTITRYGLPDLKQIGRSFGKVSSSVSSGTKKGGISGGHKGEILSIAASEDERYVVTGGKDRIVGVWEVEGDVVKWKSGMRGHKDAVTSIAIPPLNNPSHHILTASLSRHLTLHSLSTLSAIDTFFGHQDSITSISSLKPTLAVTAGSRDRTCRWWKVEEEVQLVLRGGGRTFEKSSTSEVLGPISENGDTQKMEVKVDNKKKEKGGKEFVEGSIDVVCMLDDQHFVSGGDSGSICLWNIGKKKPIFTMPFAHGIEAAVSVDSGAKGEARWITSLAALRGTDLFVSGSWDGHIRIWALEPTLKSFTQISSIPIKGFVNGLQILSIPRTSVKSSSWNKEKSSNEQSENDAIVPEESAEQERQSRKRRDKEKEVMLVAAVASEPRLGRWVTIKQDGLRNGLLVAHLKLDDNGRSMLS